MQRSWRILRSARAAYRPVTWTTLAVTALVALVFSVAMTLSHPVEMRVDGQRLIADVPPITTPSDHVFVPVRTLSDALGAETRYDARGGTIVVQRGEQTLELRLGNPHARLNGMPMTLKHAPFRVRGRVMVGLRAIARAFGVRVTYNPRTARIDIYTPGVIEAGTQTPAP